jgi:hypothetical protein
MPGSLSQIAVWPRPLSLALRLLVVTAVVLWLAHALERVMVDPLIPALRSGVSALDDTFAVTDIRVSGEGANEVVHFRANLTRPVDHGLSVIYPFGWPGAPEGSFQVTYTLGGIVQYGALTLIAILAWPASGIRELAARMLLCAPILVLLVLFEIPSTVVAELWNIVDGELDSHSLNGWMIWSRFLMGGGGLMIALLIALLCIVIAAPKTRSAKPTT